MPNGPFVARNGLIALDNSSITGSTAISGSLIVVGDTNLTGSLTISQGITGSLEGTASWAINVVNGGGGGNAFPYTGSAEITGSLTVSGSAFFTHDIFVNGLTVGKGSGSISNTTVLGEGAAAVATTGGNSVIIGYQAAGAATGISETVAIGYQAAYNLTTGNSSIFIGRQAGYDATSSFASIFIGDSSGRKTIGNRNVFIGHFAAQDNTTGEYNIALGYESSRQLTTGTQNTTIGGFAGFNLKTTTGNVFFGYDSGRNINAGNYNVAVGFKAGEYRETEFGLSSLTNVTNSIFLGYRSRANNNGETNQIVIGSDAIGLGSNTIVIGNSSTTHGRWYGSLLLGTSTSSIYILDVSGSARITDSLIVTGSLVATEITGSLFGTASWAQNAISGSYTLSSSYSDLSNTASNALTASSADNFLVRGTITAQTLVVQTVTSSIVYSSGSNIFGNQLTNVQQFTGSLRVTGSGNHWILGGNVGVGTASPTTKLHILQSGSVDTRESLVKMQVSDAGNDAFFISNGTVNNNVFWPAFAGYGESTTRAGLQFIAYTTASADTSDSSDRGLINFEALRTSSPTDPGNGTFSAIQNRKLFTFSTFTGPIITIMPTNRVGIGTVLPTAKLHVSGTVSESLFLVSSPTASAAFFVSGSGFIGVGTNTPTKVLTINTSISDDGILLRTGGTNLFSVTKDGSTGNSELFTYANGVIRFAIRSTQNLSYFNGGNFGFGTTTDAGFRLDTSGSFRTFGDITGVSGSSYFIVSHSIVQPVITGSQITEVAITPNFVFRAPNQTQTALRVAASFSGSAALTSSQSNIIADFGATSVGSQLVINDQTSGSIYMVNDVSGLPIIEANSNWDVFMYDYPSVVFKKTGSTLELGVANNTSSYTQLRSDLIINEGLGFVYRQTQVSGSTAGAVTSSLYNLTFTTVSSSVYMHAIVTGYDTGSRDTITGDVRATIRYRAGVASVVGVDQVFVNSDNSIVAFDIIAGGTSGSLVAYGTGSRTYQWGATVTTQVI